ncbi:MAG TPA: hypothetical protein VIE43_26325 [Thermoanaerobaculia bacterium]|jgi:hypothetical protein|nr:hypothetical protein [Thermoanaerobaculia bacterium]
MTEPSLEPILAYLREHSGQFSLPALREQLVQSGYDPAIVDDAIVVYRSEHPPAVRPHVFRQALQVLAVNVVLFGGMMLVQSANESAVLSFLFPMFMVFIGVELLGGIVACFPAKSRSWGLALLLGLMLSAGLGILALGGLCFSILD